MYQERPSIFGLETEHAVLFVPEDSLADSLEAARRPPFELQQKILFDCLLAGSKAAVSSGVKGGYFLQNGGLVHMEIYMRNQADSPILEVATPECRTPQDLVLYSRAYDEILEETSRRSEAVLLSQGYKGRIAFGKSNRDARGVGFGCHENYLVYSRPGFLHYVASALLAPWILLSLFPTFLLFVLVLVLASLGLLLAKLVPQIKTLALYIYSKVTGDWRRIAELCRAAYYVSSNVLLYPAIRLYSLLLELVAFREFPRNLTSFLVTRQIFAGAGSLNFRKGIYELSQRAALTRSLAGIAVIGRRKTIFDLKSFLFDPLSIFKPTKRLTIAVSDSNLADIPNLLKVGTTALLLEMVEAGESFADLRIRRPLASLKAVSALGHWKELRLRDGRKRTALEIQREYFLRAQVFFAARFPGGGPHQEILRLWEEVLDKLADKPHALSDTLDWAAKKSLLDKAILASTNWKVFFAWGRLFHRAGLEASSRAESLKELLEIVSWPRRLWISRLTGCEEIQPSDFRLQKELHFQARKLDLRYHELGGGTGYARRLEADGFLRRLTTGSRIYRAMKDPPPDTRARVRGYFIEHSPRPELLQVNWHEIELLGPVRHIPTPDPFSHRLPGDL